MKIYISADIEGIAGICDWKETEKGDDYEYFRRLMTEEVNACCNTLIKAGITDITVRDAHDSARNIIIDMLPKEVKLIRGWSNGICEMMDCLDETYDAVIFIGYHSPARSEENPLSHTQNLRHNHIKINDKIVSEYHLNTYFAQTKGVPVIMVSGDEGITNIVKSENELTMVAPTKKGYHGAILSLHPEEACRAISYATAKAIDKLKEYGKKAFFISIPNHITTEIHYRNHKDAYRATFYPGAVRVSSDKTIFNTNDIIEALKFIMFCD